MKSLQGYRRLSTGLVLLSALGLAGCGVGGRLGDHMDGNLGDVLFSRDKTLTVQASAGESLNTDPEGNSLSVVVRIYQLNAIDAFRSADMSALWTDSKGTLKESLIAERTTTLVPKGTLRNTSKLAEDAQFIGVAAFFRNATDAAWHVAFNAQALRKDGILFSSEGVQLVLKNNRIEVVRGTDVLATAAKVAH